MRQKLSVENIDVDGLLNLISELFERKLHEIEHPTQDNNEYFTRNEVSKRLKISLPTLHDYTKRGILKGYRIGGRVLYLRTDVEDSLKEIRTSK